jgi:CBS-domain-containing membrane protein
LHGRALKELNDEQLLVPDEAQRGVPAQKTHPKILWSGLGAFLGILLLAGLEEAWRAGDRGALFLIAPLGASAVLVFGAPLADFSQPRNLIGGHMLSAIVGVTTHLAWPHHMVWPAQSRFHPPSWRCTSPEPCTRRAVLLR